MATFNQELRWIYIKLIFKLAKAEGFNGPHAPITYISIKGGWRHFKTVFVGMDYEEYKAIARDIQKCVWETPAYIKADEAGELGN